MICACQVWFIFVGQYLKYLTDYLKFILLRSILDEIDRQSTRLTVRRGHWDVGPWTALEAQHRYRVSVQDLVVTDEHCTWQLPTLDGLDAVERNGRRRIREGCGRGWPISASCDLWPPDLQSRPFHALAPRTKPICIKISEFIFKISCSQVWQQTNRLLENTMFTASLAWLRDKHCVCTPWIL